MRLRDRMAPGTQCLARCGYGRYAAACDSASWHRASWHRVTAYLGDVSQLDLARYIRPGDTVAWGQACAEPLSLTEALADQRKALGGVRCFAGISAVLRPEHCDYLSVTSYTAAGANRALAEAGALDILAAHYSDLPGLLSA